MISTPLCIPKLWVWISMCWPAALIVLVPCHSCFTANAELRYNEPQSLLLSSKLTTLTIQSFHVMKQAVHTVNIKLSLYAPWRHTAAVEVQLHSFNLGTTGVSFKPRPFYSRGRNPENQLNKKLCKAQSLSGRFREKFPTPAGIRTPLSSGARRVVPTATSPSWLRR